MSDPSILMEKRAQAWLVVSGIQKYLQNRGLEKQASNPEVLFAFAQRMRTHGRTLVKEATSDYSLLDHAQTLGGNVWKALSEFSPSKDVGPMLGQLSEGLEEGWEGLPPGAQYALAAGLPAGAAGALWEGLRPRKKWDASPSMKGMLSAAGSAGIPAAIAGSLYGTSKDPEEVPKDKHKPWKTPGFMAATEKGVDDIGWAAGRLADLGGRAYDRTGELADEAIKALQAIAKFTPGAAASVIDKKQDDAAEKVLPLYQGLQRLFK